MAFHRLVVPTYFGGLPGTHDYINDPSANGDPGAPAPADAKKGSGPNEGTYFVAFGENATTLNTNRGMTALSENTDYLDDAVHTPVASAVVTASATPGAPVASEVVAGEVFVGESGTTNTANNRSSLVQVLDSNGYPLVIDVAGVRTAIKVSAITDGAINVVGTEATGFYNGPTVEYTPSIPAGTTYRLGYYARNTLMGLTQGALTRLNARTVPDEDVWSNIQAMLFGDQTLSGDKSYLGDSTFFGTATFGPGIVTLNADTTVNSTFVVNGTSTLNGSLEVNGVLNADGTFNANAVANMLGASTNIQNILNLLAVMNIGPASQWTLSDPTNHEAPWLTLPATPGVDDRILLAEFSAGTKSVRFYHGNTFNLERTYNARWDNTAKEWARDAPGAATMRSFDYVNSIESFIVKPVPALTWLDADWAGEPDDAALVSSEVGYSFGANKNDGGPLGGYNMNVPAAGVDTSYFPLVGAFRSSPLYSNYVYASPGPRGGLGTADNAFWDDSGPNWVPGAATRLAAMVSQNALDSLKIRKKYPLFSNAGVTTESLLPAAWNADEWDYEQSVRGLHFTIWTQTDTDTYGLTASEGVTAIQGVAVRPAKFDSVTSRPEQWCFLITEAGGNQASLTTLAPGMDYQRVQSCITAPLRYLQWDEEDEVYYAVDQNGVIRNYDGGTGSSWSTVPSSTDTGFGAYCAFRTSNGGGQVAWIPGTNDIREHSKGGGWTLRNNIVPGANITDMIYCERSQLWVCSFTATAGNCGIATSPDRVTWTPKTNTGSPVTAGDEPKRLAYNPDNNTVIAIGDVAASGLRAMLLRSEDGGATWDFTWNDHLDGALAPSTNRIDVGCFVYGGGRFVALATVATGDQMSVLVGDANGYRWSYSRTLFEINDGPGDFDSIGGMAVSDSAACICSRFDTDIVHTPVMAP